MTDQPSEQTNSTDTEQKQEHRGNVLDGSLIPVEGTHSRVSYPGQQLSQLPAFYSSQLPAQGNDRGLSTAKASILALVLAAIVSIGGYLVLQNLVPPLVATNLLLVLIFAAVVGVGGYFLLRRG